MFSKYAKKKIKSKMNMLNYKATPFFICFSHISSTATLTFLSAKF